MNAWRGLIARSWWSSLTAMGIAGLAGFILAVNVSESAADDSQDLAAIVKSADAFLAAYEKQDAAAIAALFTAEAEFVDGEGNVFHGRDTIRQEYESYFQANPKSKLVIDMHQVRQVGPGMLIEEGTSTSYPEGSLPATRSNYVVVHARQPDGTWLMASVRSGADQPLSPHEHLQPLAWLVGDWIDESDESLVETSWRWTQDGNFLISRFQVTKAGQSVLEGTQRIGWDPVRKQIRSWIFDSQGGFAEGFWTRTESGWLVKVAGSSADGEPASTTLTYSPVRDDMLVWTARDRVVGESIMPDVQVTVVRRPPAAGAKPTP